MFTPFNFLPDLKLVNKPHPPLSLLLNIHTHTYIYIYSLSLVCESFSFHSYIWTLPYSSLLSLIYLLNVHIYSVHTRTNALSLSLTPRSLFPRKLILNYRFWWADMGALG